MNAIGFSLFAAIAINFMFAFSDAATNIPTAEIQKMLESATLKDKKGTPSSLGRLNSRELSKKAASGPIDLSVTDFTLNQLRRLVGDDQAAQAEINEMSPEAAVEYLQGMAQEDINNPQLTEDTWLMPSLVYLNSKLPAEMRKEVEAKDLRGKLAYLSLVFGHELSQGVVKVKVAASSSSPSPAKPKSALLSSSKLLNIKNSSQFNALSEEDKRRVIAKIQKEEAAGNQSKFSPSLQAFRDRRLAAAGKKPTSALQSSVERLKQQQLKGTEAGGNGGTNLRLPPSSSSLSQFKLTQNMNQGKIQVFDAQTVKINGRQLTFASGPAKGRQELGAKTTEALRKYQKKG